MVSRPASTLLLAAVATLLAACSAGGTPPPRPAGPPPPTPIARLNTSEMELHRIPFCDLLPRAAVTGALGAKPVDQATWGFGDASRYVGGSGDRAQEFGCRFSAGSSVAEAWVSATPVDSALAQQLVRDAVGRDGCRDVTAASFGSPSVEQLCRQSGGVVRVRHAGLFGDAWLSCEVSGPLPSAEVARRSGAWCVQVANTLNTAH